MQPLDYVLIALATFYLAYVFTITEGPWKSFAKLRFWMPMGGLTKCIYCAAIWIALICYWLYTTPLQPIVACCGVAGAGMAVYRYTGGSHV